MNKLNAPKPGTTDSLDVMLRFICAMPGTNPFAPLDAEKIFRAMRAELGDLVPSDLTVAAGLASQIAKQMRSVSWRLRYGHDEPKTPPKLDKAKLRPLPAGKRRFESNDARLLALPGVMEQWRIHLGLGRQWKVQDVIKRARDAEEFQAVLLGVAEGKDGSIDAQRLGIWLSYIEGVSCDDVNLRRVEGKLYPRWVLVED